MTERTISSVRRSTSTDPDSISPDEFRALRNAIPIEECGEPLVEIPLSIARVALHPYVQAGAPYQDTNPFQLRSGVVERLSEAQASLGHLHPGFRLIVYDAYRPLPVQTYMREWSVTQLAKSQAIDLHSCSRETRMNIEASVHAIWAPPNPDPSAPPPHSTGGAVDVTIVHAEGHLLDMGSGIDSLPPECHPQFYRASLDESLKRKHANRELLREVMCDAGFQRLPYEWWHFSFGDQSWAVLENQTAPRARYGRVPLP